MEVFGSVKAPAVSFFFSLSNAQERMSDYLTGALGIQGNDGGSQALQVGKQTERGRGG